MGNNLGEWLYLVPENLHTPSLPILNWYYDNDHEKLRLCGASNKDEFPQILTSLQSYD